MAEELESPPEPKRTRRTKVEMQAAKPPFDPELSQGHLSATAKRTVRTGQFESFEIMIHCQMDRDPRFSVVENMAMLGAAASQEANSIADRIQRTITVEK
jgi:hypothetical protein